MLAIARVDGENAVGAQSRNADKSVGFNRVNSDGTGMVADEEVRGIEKEVATGLGRTKLPISRSVSGKSKAMVKPSE